MIRVSRKQVKQSHADLMPPATPFRVLQSTAKLARAALAGVDELVVVSPERVPAAVLRVLPELKPLKTVASRLGKSATTGTLRGRLGNHATGISWTRLPATGNAGGKSAFDLLELARRAVTDTMRDNPRSIGILVVGCSAEQQAAAARALLLAIGAHAHRGPAFRVKQDPCRLRTIRVLGLDARLPLERTLAEIDNANLVRWLTALPANKLTAMTYRGLLQNMARQHGWQFDFHDEVKLRKAGAGAFLAVSQGNAGSGAGIARLRYRPGKRRVTDIALVGKGIMFDTGGTNLKDARNMRDMHTDMSGSAVALGVLRALTALDAPVAVDCWLAITENRTGPDAYKPADVVTASNGVTIEVVHTDAEGRMALADTLALAGRDKPGLIIDYATLTGTCVHAVSDRYSGVFTNRDELNTLLITAGRTSGERVWPFPMDDDFDQELKSEVADVAQCTLGGAGDHILAARLLSRFVPKQSAWIHVDLASVSRKQGLAQMPAGLTGFGVRYSLALLLDHAGPLQAVTGKLGLRTSRSR